MASVDSIYCPGCKRHTALTEIIHYDRYPVKFEVAECNNCAQHFLSVRDLSSDKILAMYPQTLPGHVNEKIPKAIKVDFEEALVCEAAGSYRGAAALARRTLQVICLDKGAPENKKLHQQIDWLFDNNIITKDIKDWAHEVRYVGNDAAHPNATTVTKDDAHDILDLLESMCDVLYIAPARAAERKAKRTAMVKVSDEN